MEVGTYVLYGAESLLDWRFHSLSQVEKENKEETNQDLKHRSTKASSTH
jgi:hypothetical protein